MHFWHAEWYYGGNPFHKTPKKDPFHTKIPRTQPLHKPCFYGMVGSGWLPNNQGVLINYMLCAYAKECCNQIGEAGKNMLWYDAYFVDGLWSHVGQPGRLARCTRNMDLEHFVLVTVRLFLCPLRCCFSHCFVQILRICVCFFFRVLFALFFVFFHLFLWPDDRDLQTCKNIEGKNGEKTKQKTTKRRFFFDFWFCLLFCFFFLSCSDSFCFVLFFVFS